MTDVMDTIKKLEDIMFVTRETQDREDFVDFPYIEDPEEYKTHRPYEDPYGEPFSTQEGEEVREQGEEDEAAGGVEKGDIAPPPAKGDEEETPPEGGGAEELGAGPEGEEGGAMEEPLDVDQAVGEKKEELTAGEIGRVFELKKIYSRLVSMEAYLSANVDTDLIDLRNKVSQSINLFEVVISNFNVYKEKIDDIIVSFYKIVKEVYGMIREYYKKEANMMENE
jgi:hypothetical protein